MRIYGLFFSILLSSALIAQEKGETKESFFRPDGIIVGVDVSKFLLNVLQPERTEFEGSLDLGLNENFYLVGEFGVTDYKYTGGDFLYDYYSDGYYWRTGFCYNFLKDRERDDLVSVGLLFGHASFNHSAENLSIIDNRYGLLNISSLSFPDQQANWIEPYFALKVEIFANFFLGWSLRAKAFLGGSDFDELKPNVLPGFGKFNGNSNACVTYNIYYKIPFRGK
ncbi:MAG: hypothetical protein JXB49_36215 [Bacteroidales bacterium]|nr:hypothetical protein [Bacteroidales bacterium]